MRDPRLQQVDLTPPSTRDESMTGQRWTQRALTCAFAVMAAACVFLPSPAVAQDGSQLRVWLLTAAPGDQVWERYGHNAIRVLDERTGRDVSYNWGIFDFQQVDFIPRFLRGEMLYSMAAFDTEAMVAAYARANREVVLQELALTPEQKLRLVSLAETNLLPENRDYIYQYFLDNCSTRVRDMLDAVLGGALNLQYSPQPSGTSYRDNTQRLTQVDPLIFTGMDLALGAPTDASISVWEEMFIPMTLRDELRTFRVVRPDGGSEPFVRSEQVVVTSTRAADPEAPPGWFGLYAALGGLLALVFASMRTSAVQSRTWLRRTITGLAVAWYSLWGTLGAILVALLFTDHTFAFRNENLFLAHPLLWLAAFALLLSARGGKWGDRAGVVALMGAAIGLIGLFAQLLPMMTHANAHFFALILPGHLALAFGLISHRGRSPGR